MVDKKDKVVSKKSLYAICRVTPDEKLALEKLSIREGLSLSETYRMILREGLKSRGLEAIGLFSVFGEDLMISKGSK